MTATGSGQPDFWGSLRSNIGNSVYELFQLPGSSSAQNARLRKELETANLQSQLQAIEASSKPASQKRQETIDLLRGVSQVGAENAAQLLKQQQEQLGPLLDAKQGLSAIKINEGDKLSGFQDRSETNRITTQGNADVSRIKAVGDVTGNLYDRNTAGQIALTGAVMPSIDRLNDSTFGYANRKLELDDAYNNRFLDVQQEENRRNRPLAVMGQLGGFLAPIITALVMR